MNFNNFTPIVHREKRYHFVGANYRISDAKGGADSVIETPHVGIKDFIKSKKPQLKRIANIDIEKYQYIVQAYKEYDHCNVCVNIPGHFGIVKKGRDTVTCPNCNGKGFAPFIPKYIEISGIKVDSEIFAQIIAESKELHLVYIKGTQIVLESNLATYYINF